MNASLRNKLLGSLVAVAILAMGAVLYWHSNGTMGCEERFSLLNPNSRCNAAHKREWDYEGLRERLVQFIDAAKQNKDVAQVSVYFRQLDNGPRFGVGEYDHYYLASLLKVPVMIAMLHAADADPTLLSQELQFQGKFISEQNVENPDETIKPNTPYTTAELLRRMIVFSDNFSKEVLLERLRMLPGSTVRNAYMDLGMFPIMSGESETISIQSYAYLFAVLYNVGYLSPEKSQLALELLSQTTFNDGLVAGVPIGTKVAHKFGIRGVPTGLSELHDCGIVYHPAGPYVLCVMTNGRDLHKNASVIANISSMVYDEVNTMNAGT
jgi:beta-lactamase class A